MYTTNEQKVIDYLKLFRGQSGLYVIRVKKEKSDVLQKICKHFGIEHRSDVAYVGKAAKLQSTNIYIRAKQEMGWSNFSGATFVKKIGKYLGLNISDISNKEAQLKTRSFILETFDIECKILPENKDLLMWETEQISYLKACLNDKKNK